jgi:hypothetical protein
MIDFHVVSNDSNACEGLQAIKYTTAASSLLRFRSSAPVSGFLASACFCLCCSTFRLCAASAAALRLALSSCFRANSVSGCALGGVGGGRRGGPAGPLLAELTDRVDEFKGSSCRATFLASCSSRRARAFASRRSRGVWFASTPPGDWVECVLDGGRRVGTFGRGRSEDDSSARSTPEAEITSNLSEHKLYMVATMNCL